MTVAEESVTQSLNVTNSVALFLTGIVALLVLYHYWFQSLRYARLGNKLPGLTSLPFIGDVHHLIGKSPSEILQFAFNESSKRGKVLRFWIGLQLYVGLLDPRDVELVLGSSVHLEKSADYRYFEPWLGDGLLISKGEKWRTHRKMIAPTFHQSILKTFMPTFNKNATELVEILRKNVVGQICDIHDYMSGATVDVLLETVMGAKKTKEADTSFKYAKAVMDMCAILHFRHTAVLARFDWFFKWTKYFSEQILHLKTIHSLTDNVIKFKKEAYFERVKEGKESLYPNAVRETEEENKLPARNDFGLTYGSALRDDLDENDDNIGEKKRLAFLDFMIEANQTSGKLLSDTDIREEVNTIMFEGHDTTAAASSFFLCMLGVYPDIQERVLNELNEIFQGSDRPVTFNDTMEMKYLERVLLETLRLYPPVPLITRYIREDLKLASMDVTIPANTTIAIPQFAIHRDERYFPNPEQFDPDNFLPERCQQRHFYSYVPFSAGPRSCVGRKYAVLKLKVLLAYLVRHFKITSVVKEKDFELQGDIILKRADGFRIILEDRK